MQSSGPISLGDVNENYGNPRATQISMNGLIFRDLVFELSSENTIDVAPLNSLIKLSDAYGKSFSRITETTYEVTKNTVTKFNVNTVTRFNVATEYSETKFYRITDAGPPGSKDTTFTFVTGGYAGTTSRTTEYSRVTGTEYSRVTTTTFNTTTNTTTQL
jgi:hypothetical protein